MALTITKRRQRIRSELNVNLEPAARDILDKYAPPRTATRGKFLARLLFEFAAREEERQRLLGLLRGEDGTPT